MTSPRTLLLMRHARAQEFAPGLSDAERPLTPAGTEQARAVGDYLRELTLDVDHVLCSSAVRTEQTCRELGLATRVTVSNSIYNAGSDTILQTVAETFDDDVHVGLVIGHAPGIPALAHVLADPATSDETALRSVEFQFPTATLVELTFTGAWNDLQIAELRSVRLGV